MNSKILSAVINYTSASKWHSCECYFAGRINTPGEIFSKKGKSKILDLVINKIFNRFRNGICLQLEM
jgi:hypothetical protein